MVTTSPPRKPCVTAETIAAHMPIARRTAVTSYRAHTSARSLRSAQAVPSEVRLARMFRDDRFGLGLVERRQRCRDDASLIGISDVRVGVAGVRMLPYGGASCRRRLAPGDAVSLGSRSQSPRSGRSTRVCSSAVRPFAFSSPLSASGGRIRLAMSAVTPTPFRHGVASGGPWARPTSLKYCDVPADSACRNPQRSRIGRAAPVRQGKRGGSSPNSAKFAPS